MGKRAQRRPQAPAPRAWWQRGVIYQIWVRSFYDTDGDGSGDINGIIAKLDYLRWLGVDVLWLSPIYPSPMAEAGYDVSDYSAVGALFGSLEDFDRLLAEAHRRELRVILDFVPNHTSDCHPWFCEARASRSSDRRDWYIWAGPQPDGGPPTNWVSAFGGSAWTYDKETRQFYYHVFLPQQPDLNWRNGAVRAAVHDAMRFWLDRGVDGFRLDAVGHLIKDDRLRDNPPNLDYSPDMPPDSSVLNEYTRERPEVHGLLAELRQVVDERPDRLLAGELYVSVEELMTYYGSHARPELHLPLNLQLSLGEWDADRIRAYIEEYEAALPPGAWPNWSLSTHDSTRIASRAGQAQARVAAMLLLTLRGTPTIYYGDEIGAPSVEVPREAITDPRELRAPYRGLGRDPARTPLPWDDQPNGGFSAGAPWLPLDPQHRERNVARQREDRRSILSLYRQLLALRRAQPALVEGSYTTVRGDERLLAYERAGAGQRLLVALNFAPAPQRLALPGRRGQVLLSTMLDRTDDQLDGALELRGDEGVIVRLEP